MKPKLAFIGVKYYPSKGGTSRVVENLARQLAYKYDITVYCYKNTEAENNIPGVRVVQFPVIPLGSFGVFIYYLLCTVHAMIFGKYELVHVHKIDASVFIPLLLKKFRVVATSHESPYLRDKWSRLGKKYFMVGERIFIRSSAVLTCISKPLSAYYEEKHKRKVQYISNGINLVSDPDHTGASAVLKKYNIREGYIMFAARRIMASKGIGTMFAALENIKFRGDVVVAGDTSHVPQYMKKLLKEYKGLNIKLTGYISSLNTLLALVQGAEVFIFPSETEGMSIMLLEVASMCTPLVCSDIPENKEVFSEDEVVYFRNRDPLDLGKKISEILANRDAGRIKVQNAQRKIISMYSWEKIAKVCDELYLTYIQIEI